jgi:hypothetical protein
MKDYSTIISDHLGHNYEFKISINEKQRSGKMFYLNEEYILSRCSKSTVKSGLHFLMHIGQYIKVNVLLISICEEQLNLLELVVGEAITKYTLNEESCIDYKSYVSFLNLPNATQSEFNIYEEKQWGENLEFVALKPQLSLYLGWFPFDLGSFVKFVNVTVNNLDVDLSSSYNMPNGQGVIVPLGNFASNQPLIISWKCETFYTPLDAKIVVGYFLNNDLNTRKILRIRNVDHYEEWTDSATITLNINSNK